MPITNRSPGKALLGDVRLTQAAAGSLAKVYHGTVARTDTSAKTLFTLPPGAVIMNVKLYGATGSDAGTTATVAVGKTGGTGSDFLAATSVKGTAGVGDVSAAANKVLGSVGATAVVVTATYAETGGASTTGGPWDVWVEATTS